MNIRKVERRIIDVRRPSMGGIRKAFDDIEKASFKKYMTKLLKRASKQLGKGYDLEYITTLDGSMSGGKGGRNHDFVTKFFNNAGDDPNEEFSFGHVHINKIRNDGMIMSEIRRALRGGNRGDRE